MNTSQVLKSKCMTLLREKTSPSRASQPRNDVKEFDAIALAALLS